MKKALSYLLALAMVVTMIPAAAFADKKADEAMTPEKALEALKGYGVIKGDGTQDPFKPESELKRQDAAVILVRLLGVEKEAKALEVKEKPFMDIPSDDFYKSIIQYVKDKGIFKGISAEKFGFNDKLTAQQFATIQLRALGYEVESEDAYKKALETAKKMGLLKGTSELKDDTKILRKDVYVIMNNTLETPKKDGKKALKYELGLAQEPVAEKLEVVDATPNGLKVLKVEFSREVDEDSLKSVEITDKDYSDVSLMKDGIVLSEDKKVAIFKFKEAAKQNEVYKVAVADVRTEDKKEKVEKFEKKILFVDTDRPVVNSVEVLNPREMVISVSEPISVNPNAYAKYKSIKIDDIDAYAKVSDDFNGKLELTLYKALKEGDHKIVIDGLEDYAKLPSAAFEQDITVVDDKEAPAIAEGKMLSANSVLVTFNENVDKIGSFKVDGNTTSKTEYYKDSKKMVKLTLSKALSMGAIVEVKVEYKGQKDIMGNEVKNWEKFSFSVADDTDLPTAEFKDFDKDDATKVEIKFSKPMSKEGEFKLKDSKGKVLHAGKISAVKYYKQGEKDVDESILVFSFASLDDKDPADYTLILEKLQDNTLRKNELPKTEIAFKGKDTKAPTVVEGYTSDMKDNQVIYTLVFSEKMDRDSLLAKANYSLQKNDDAATRKRLDTIADSKIRIFDDNTKVQLIIKADKHPLFEEANLEAARNVTKIFVIGVKDESGKEIVAKEHGKAAGTPVKLDGAKTPELSQNADGVFQLKFYFDTEVKINDISKFEITEGSFALNGEDLDKYSKEFVFDIEGVKFTADAKNIIDQDGNKKPLPKYTIRKEAVKSAVGAEFDPADVVNKQSYEDKIVPMIAKKADSEDFDVDVNEGNQKQIEIVYNEKLSQVVSASVEKDGKSLNVNKNFNSKKAILTLEENAKTGDEYTIRISVKDEKGNATKVETLKLNVGNLPQQAAELDVTLAASETQVGKTKVTLSGAHSYAYKKGEFYPVLNSTFNDATVVANNGEVELDQGEKYTFVGLNADNKVLKYKVVTVEAQHIAVGATPLAKIELVAGTNPLTANVVLLGTGANNDPKLINYQASNNDQFKVKVTKAAMDAAQTVKLSVSEVASDDVVDEAASIANLALEQTPSCVETSANITVKKTGKFNLTVKVLENGKVADQLTFVITVE